MLILSGAGIWPFGWFLDTGAANMIGSVLESEDGSRDGSDLFSF